MLKKETDNTSVSKDIKIEAKNKNLNFVISKRMIVKEICHLLVHSTFPSSRFNNNVNCSCKPKKLNSILPLALVDCVDSSLPQGI